MECTNRKRVITLLETSDVHGYVLPINYADNKPIEAGLAKLSSIIKQEREQNENLILIDNGDILQGTPLTYYYSRINSTGENPVIKVMNYLGYDGAVIGNHEFNYGQDILKKAIKESKFPWLSGNISKAENGELLFGKPYIIKEFSGGLRVAVLGLTTKYIPNWENPVHIEGLQFSDAVEKAEEWVKYLKEKERAQVVIVSYHGGFERSIETGQPTEQQTGENEGYELCLKIPGIDVLLTGHQHKTISGRKLNGVIIVQPGAEGRSLGKVTITLECDGEWKIVDTQSCIISAENAPVDENIKELSAEYEERTQQWLDTPIGKIKGDMNVTDPMKIRIRDNPLIEFFNRVQMENSGVDISAAALFHDNAPGLESDVTMRDIVSNYIYPNTLRVIRVKGEDIKAALERSAAYFEVYDGKEIRQNKNFSISKAQPYNYDMWEGISYKLNISRPIGSRVVELKYHGKPLDPEGEYDVVMNNYRAGGGGEYPMFKDKPVIKDIPTDVSELIANYILERGTIEATVDNNWEVIHD